MNIFKIFQSRKKEYTDLSPVEILKEIIEFIPEIHHTNRQFVAAVEFLKYHEFGLTLESLIELVDESGNYFSEEYWLRLATAANKMQREKELKYSYEQIAKTKNEIDFKIPVGSTVLKAKDHFQIFTAEKIKNQNAETRRKKHGVQNFIGENGFKLIEEGRSGVIYYVESGKLLEIEVEKSGSSQFDLLVYFDQTKFWSLPEKQLLTEIEKNLIKSKLAQWLTAKKIRAEF